MNDARTQLVADCSDEIGESFAAWRDQTVGDPRRECEDEPETRRLASRFRLTGVDISARQVDRARATLPEVELVYADLAALELTAHSFDAVVSFYVFNHVPEGLASFQWVVARR